MFAYMLAAPPRGQEANYFPFNTLNKAITRIVIVQRQFLEIKLNMS